MYSFRNREKPYKFRNLADKTTGWLLFICWTKLTTKNTYVIALMLKTEATIVAFLLFSIHCFHLISSHLCYEIYKSDTQK